MNVVVLPLSPLAVPFAWRGGSTLCVFERVLSFLLGPRKLDGGGVRPSPLRADAYK